MTEVQRDAGSGFELADDATWVWRGGGILGARQFPRVLGFLVSPILAASVLIAILGSPGAALTVLVATTVLLATVLLLFARFTAFYRVIEIRGSQDRLRLRFAWGMRRSYPTERLQQVEVVHTRYRDASTNAATTLRLTFRDAAGNRTEKWLTGQTAYAPGLESQLAQVLSGASIGSTTKLITRQRSGDWR